MSSKKINYSHADSIATLIANKAFEHLINPLKSQLEAVAKKYVLADIEAFGGMRRLIDAGFFRANENGTLIVYFHQTTSGEAEHHCVDLKLGLVFQGWNDYRIINDDAFKELVPIIEQFEPLKLKRSSLQNTLQQQLEGKTVKQALSAWPEASQFINQVMGVNDKVEMTQPLEQLLARFLPMLPAPAHSEGV